MINPLPPAAYATWSPEEQARYHYQVGNVELAEALDGLTASLIRAAADYGIYDANDLKQAFDEKDAEIERLS